MRIAVAADHAGFSHKALLVRALRDDGHDVVDLGTTSTAPVDYPDFALAVGTAVREGHAEVGVLICGSGAGVAIAANKIRGVRAALCHDLFTARQSREDDDANVLCLGARVIDAETAIALARQFVGARFSHEARHERRLAKVLALDSGVAACLERERARLERLGAVERLWNGDPTLWSADESVQAAVASRLGWLTSPGTMPGHLRDLHAFADAVRRDRVTEVVLLGMGGSSLAAEVLSESVGAAPGAPAVTVLDTTDPGAIRNVLARLKAGETLFLVSSKSGTTTEVHALYRFFRAELDRQLDHAGAQFVAITDAGTPLERLAAAGGFRRTFLNDPGVGGRFSALTLFGLVPGVLLGVDVRTLLERATAMAERCRAATPGANPGLSLGATIGALAAAGRDKLTLALSEPIRSFGAWLEQLLTESTGKNGKGVVVVRDEPLGPPSRYGDDRVFVAITLGGDRAFEPRLAALEGAGFPVIRLDLADRLDLGGEFFRWELATAVAGIVLGVNPFDEPNVAQAKAATQAALTTFRETGRLPEWPLDEVDDAARALRDARPGDYVALLAYLTPTAATTAALEKLRTLLRDTTRLATTVGYGPRYLHSTGQLHKGGPATPILILLTADGDEDLAVPGEPYGFATLKRAQALGDLATLKAAHRRVHWLTLGRDVPEGLARLTAALGKVLA